MKTIVLFSANLAFKVEIKVDLFTSSEAFTVMSIENRSTAEVTAGLDLKELPSSVSGMKAYAESLNLAMSIYDIDPDVAVIETVPVGGLTAVSVDSAGALTAGNDAVPYSEKIVVTGGNGPFTFEVASGALPSGLVLDAGTGAITGTPDTVENPSFTITATDAFGGTDTSASCSINIAA